MKTARSDLLHKRPKLRFVGKTTAKQVCIYATPACAKAWTKSLQAVIKRCKWQSNLSDAWGQIVSLRDAVQRESELQQGYLKRGEP